MPIQSACDGISPNRILESALIFVILATIANIVAYVRKSNNDSSNDTKMAAYQTLFRGWTRFQIRGQLWVLLIRPWCKTWCRASPPLPWVWGGFPVGYRVWENGAPGTEQNHYTPPRHTCFFFSFWGVTGRYVSKKNFLKGGTLFWVILVVHFCAHLSSILPYLIGLFKYLNRGILNTVVPCPISH